MKAMSVSGAPFSSSTEIQSQNDRSTRRLGAIVAATLCILPLLLVLGILWKEATGLPLADDYHAVLVFALDQRHLSAGEKLLSVVTAQHNEYKLIFEHALVAADLAATGRLNMALLVWLGNLFLVPLGFIYWLQFRPDDSAGRRLLLFAPLCWLLFQLTYAELLDWAMEGLVGIAVVFFSVAALYLLTRSSRGSFVWACIFGGLAACSSANGFLVAAVGAGILLLQRRLLRLVPWIVTFGVALAAYLYRYSPADHGGTPASLPMKLLFFSSFLGGAIENMHGFPVHHAAIVLGVGMLLVYAHSIWSGYYKRQPFIVATATWAILTALMTAWVRSSLGLGLSLSSRYKIYSTLLIVFCYQYLADRVIASELFSLRAKRAVYSIVLAVAVLFALASDVVGMKLLRTRRAEAITALGWYLSDPQTHSPFSGEHGRPDETRDVTGNAIEARRSLTEALALGIYQIPLKDRVEACANRPCNRPAR